MAKPCQQCLSFYSFLPKLLSHLPKLPVHSCLMLQLHLDDSKLLPAFTPEALLPEGIPGLVQQVLAWPGMSALLGWVSGGHFLGGLGPDDLGRALLDVQVSQPMQRAAALQAVLH